nr:hypothetical protein [Tanacetum cinerariifolium]
EESDSGLSFNDSGLDCQRFTSFEDYTFCSGLGNKTMELIDEGLFKMGKFRETLAEGAQGPERDRVFKDLKPEEKDRYKADQHEAHANENKMMLERHTQHAIDPLAFMSNVSLQQLPTQSSAIPQSGYVPPFTYPPQFADNAHLDSGFTLTDDLIENLTKTVALLA